jgi:cytochrome P450
MAQPVPSPSPQAGLRALRAILQQRSVVPALSVFHAEAGDIFRLSAFNFSAIMLAGPEAGRFILTDQREAFQWRLETDPITDLLVHSVLVEDGAVHDAMRDKLAPSLHRRMMQRYADSIRRRTDQVIDTWADGQQVDMLVEARKIALLALMDSLFEVDYSPELERLWRSVIYLINFISPGLWMFWGGVPRPGYRKYRAQMDGYLYDIIRLKRTLLERNPTPEHMDMVSYLIYAGMPEERIRDQLMTMLIAGHDTSTAQLSWVFHLLGQHPQHMQRLQAEVDNQLGSATPDAENTSRLGALEQVIKEALRLYPPIHIGSRTALKDLEFKGVHIPAGTRVLYSIYLTHRHPQYWDAPDQFLPERFDGTRKYDPYQYLPFGMGKRNCIGAVFAQHEARIVLARVLQRVQLRAAGRAHVHIHMGATLEPRPGVPMTVQRR